MAIADLFVYAELGGRLADVVEDGGPVGDGLGVAPGAEPVTERVHVRVRPDAGIAEQVPCAAHRVSPLKDGETLPRVPLPQVAGGANPGETGAHDHNVEMFHAQSFDPAATAIWCGKYISSILYRTKRRD